MLRLFSKFTGSKPAQVTKVNVPAPVQPSDPRKAMLQRLAIHFRDKTSIVFQQHAISGKLMEWHVAPRYISIGIRLHNSRDLKKAKALTEELGVAVGIGQGTKTMPVEVVYIGGLMVYQFSLPEYISPRSSIRLWEDITVEHPALEGAVGFGLYEQPVFFEFTQEAPHAVVAGTSGSGKTELLKTAIYQWMTHYPVADLGLAIADPKGDYIQFANEEHLLWQPAHDPEEITKMITLYHAEYRRRLQHNLWNERRWVLVIDEADQRQLLMDPDNQERILDIVNRGRSLNMNVVVGTHIPNKGSLGDIVAGLTNKFYGMMGNAKESGQVQGGLNLHKLAGKGDFMHVIGNTEFRFQAAMVMPEHLLQLTKVDTIMPVMGVPMPAPDYLVQVERNQAGRPKIEPDPEMIAYYLFHGPDRVTSTEAANNLGLKRTGHSVNQTFAEQVQQALAALRLTHQKVVA